jgi:hypothetical protein
VRSSLQSGFRLIVLFAKKRRYGAVRRRERRDTERTLLEERKGSREDMRESRQEEQLWMKMERR